MPGLPSNEPDSWTARIAALGWIAGLPVLAVLWAAASLTIAPVVSAGLWDAAAAIIRQDGTEPGLTEPWLRVESSGRDLTALGEASDEGRRKAVLAKLAELPGLRRLVDATGAVEDASPFVWQASLTADRRIELTGHRPSGLGATALAARLASELPADVALTDRSRAARGGPPDFAVAASYAVERLRSLKPGATALLTDTVLSFEGEAADPSAYDAFRTTLAAPPQGFTIGKADIGPPMIADFHLVVERRADGAVILSGNVVSEAARTELRATADELAAGSPVEDRMRTARSPASDLDPSALNRVVARLAGLIREGSVRFEGDRLSVSGVAIDAQAIGEAGAILRDERPAGIAAGPIDLTARPVSPYRLRLRRDAESVVVTGHLPDEGSRAALLANLRARFVHEAVTDRARIAEGAPDGLLAAATAASRPLSTLASGEIAISDRDLTLSGESLYAQSAERVNETLPRSVPTGWTASARIVAMDTVARFDPTSCAKQFTERVVARPLRFATGSSDLTPDFFAVLDAAADLARHCPTQRVEVSGHGDPVGAVPQQVRALPEYTSSIREPDKAKKPEKDAAKKSSAKPKPQAAKPEPKPAEPPADLAQQRALAVIDYLQKAGIPADRVVAAPSPAGPNDGGERRAIGLALRS